MSSLANGSKVCPAWMTFAACAAAVKAPFRSIAGRETADAPSAGDQQDRGDRENGGRNQRNRRNRRGEDRSDAQSGQTETAADSRNETRTETQSDGQNESGQQGDSAGLFSLADSYAGRLEDGSYSNLLDANIAINCADSDPDRTVDEDDVETLHRYRLVRG